MADYKSMYFLLFNQISDIITQLENIQKQAEEMYVESEKASLLIYNKESDE